MCWKEGLRKTHFEETTNSRPHAVIWELPPSSGMQDGPLIDASTDKVHHHSNQHDDTEDAARPDELFYRLGSTACRLRSHLEEVGALVWGGPYEGCSGWRGSWIAIAEEGDSGGLGAGSSL